MMNDKRIKESDFSYDELLQLKEHVKQYNNAFDKREFLKNIIPYEQKLILLNSTRPYEVLNYLDTLEQKNTNLIIESLNYDEIFKIINLFSIEEKEKFYNTFSNLALVNKFIKYDNNSKEYVQSLTIDRKIELLDSTTSKTSAATDIIYSSMNTQEKKIAEEKVTTLDGLSNIHNSREYKEISAIDVNESNQLEFGDSNLKKTILKEQIKDRIVPPQVENEQINNIIPEYSPYNVNFDLENITKLYKYMLINKPTDIKIEFKSSITQIQTPEEILAKFDEVTQKTENKELEIIKSNITKAKVASIEIPKLNLPKIVLPQVSLSKDDFGSDIPKTK